MGLDLRVPGAKWKQRVGSSVELGPHATYTDAEKVVIELIQQGLPDIVYSVQIEKVYLPDYDPLKGGDPNAKPQ